MSGALQIFSTVYSMTYINTLITGLGSYVPNKIVKNADFLDKEFFDESSKKLESSSEDIIRKFNEITGIEERRYLTPEFLTSDMAFFASQKAIENAGIDVETIDQIIVAHNFGDIKEGTIQTDAVPSLASRVKRMLKIKNPSCIAYDILFGCPGWVQGVIHADAFIKSGLGRRFLVIGAEALSRVIDPVDRDSMIYSDGAGAAIVEGVEESEKRGFLSSSMQTDTVVENNYLYMRASYKPESDPKVVYLKMQGRKIYEYGISKVPAAMKLALERADVDLSEVKKILIHQANEKMDEAMVKRLYRLYKQKETPDGIMPMSIHLLGNSSVATIPTLYDKLLKGEYPEHEINPGDILLFASVGAGLSVNAFVYKQ